MTGRELLPWFFSLLFGAALAWGIYRRNDPELSSDRQWAPVLAPWLLPLFLISLLAILSFTGAGKSLPFFGALCLGIFLHMSVYYVLLIAVSPLLRRWISARACAVLWLLPNMLYICQQYFMRRNVPLWIIRVQGNWMRWAVLLWLAGAAGLFLWKCLEHLRFRRRLKDLSWQERDETVKEIWTAMQRSAKIKKKNIPLLRSHNIASPLSVGLFPASTFVVLPETEYTAEEISLILRHELVHIVRRDAQTKLFLTFCTAVCWFNPLMWTAVRHCAEDLELSCDELVLEYSDGAEKKLYADLILRCTGEPRGFTSNLAASASSLRYRLKQIMAPGRRLTGGITAGVALCLLLGTSGITAIAYGSGTAAELAFENQLLSEDSIGTVELGTRTELGGVTLLPCTCTDAAAFVDYLSGLEVCRLSGNYEMQRDGTFLELWLPGTGGPRLLTLEEHSLQLWQMGGNHSITELWYLENAPDWAYIQSLLVEQEEPNAIPYPPMMEIVFGPESAIDDPEPLTSMGRIVENTLNGKPSDHFLFWEDSACGIEGFSVRWADLTFTIDIPPEEVAVTAWDSDRAECRSFPLDENFRISLLPYSAHYTVEARWEFGTDEGMQVYRMEYAFDVGLPEE